MNKKHIYSRGVAERLPWPIEEFNSEVFLFVSSIAHRVFVIVLPFIFTL